MSSLRRRVFGASVILTFWGLASYYAIRSHHDAPFVAAAKRFGLSDRVMAMDGIGFVADGGTVYAYLSTRSGDELVVCLDGRMRELAPNEKPPVRKVFIGGYPEEEGSVALVPSSEDEKALLFILSSIEDPPEKSAWVLRKIMGVLEGRNTVGGVSVGSVEPAGL